MSDAKFVTVNGDGAASGSVWHRSEGCTAQSSSNLREVTDDEIQLLGFTQCRACLRYEKLTSDDVIVQLMETLKAVGLEAYMKCDLANAARNVNRELQSRGLQLIFADTDDTGSDPS